MRQRAARVVLWALILAVPAAYLPQLFGSGPTAPSPRRPAWVHLIAVTASHWEAAPPGAPPPPALEAFYREATGFERAFAPATATAGSAASLWTGRWPAHHGVLSNDLALAPGSWTLAEAARRSGARTAAFLEEPFVTATGIGGFETVLERPELGPAELARAGAAFLREHPEERVLLWLHLERSGPGGRAVAEVLEGLAPALEETRRAHDALTLVTAFAGEGPPGSDARHRVPLFTALPAALLAGRRSPGSASPVDLAGVLRELLRLPHPDEAAGEASLQSRPYLEAGLKGASGYELSLIHI